MINSDIFLVALLASSTLSGIATEAMKKILSEWNISYKSNTLAGAVAFCVSIGVSVCYILANQVAMTNEYIAYAMILTFMSWLCSMVGYDKVVQTISQLQTNIEEVDTNE